MFPLNMLPPTHEQAIRRHKNNSITQYVNDNKHIYICFIDLINYLLSGA